ncbi:hypothetical protein AGMMS49992_00760 [Clostridia bacterium]|nr:hypothetical protein AGMMS49992_00760 [Clostridia bacterium]
MHTKRATSLNMKAITKIIALTLSILTMLTISQPALADKIPLTTRASNENGMVRVRLDSIGKPGVYNLTTTGAYTAGGISIPSGASVAVSANGGSFTMSVNGSTHDMGASFWMARASNGSGAKIQQSSASGNVYPGDFRFYYSGGSAALVCRVYIEDYLLGVVGYEMSDSFPLDALKAQAITARTYAMKRLSSGSDWDVRDTTSDQVYKGTGSGANVKAAVQATSGMALMYNNEYCSVYYSSSNGGQTETNGHAWGGSALPYYKLQDDPYDLANPSSTVRKATIYAEFSQNTSALQSLVTGKAGNVSRINAVETVTPKYDSPSRLYTQLKLNVTKTDGSSASVTLDLFGGAANALGMSLSGQKNELFTVETASDGFRLMARRYGHGVGLSQYGAQQMAKIGYDYLTIMGFYFPGATLVKHSYTASLLNGSGTATALADNNSSSEDSTASTAASSGISAVVALDDPAARLNLRKSPKSNADVVAKIPNGSTIQVENTDASGWLKATFAGRSGYIASQYVRYASDGAVTLPSPTASAAPEAPTTTTASAPSQMLGTGIVSLESSSGHLNLRESPTNKAKVLIQAPQGASVEVYAQSGQWMEIRYKGTYGYAAAQFIRMNGSTAPVVASVPVQTNTSTTTPAEAFTLPTAKVKTESGTGNVYLRAKANRDSVVLEKIPHGTSVIVVGSEGDWVWVEYKGKSGYILSDYLTY